MADSVVGKGSNKPLFVIKHCAKTNPSCSKEFNVNDPHTTCMGHNTTCFANHTFDSTDCDPCQIIFSWPVGRRTQPCLASLESASLACTNLSCAFKSGKLNEDTSEIRSFQWTRSFLHPTQNIFIYARRQSPLLALLCVQARSFQSRTSNGCHVSSSKPFSSGSSLQMCLSLHCLFICY